MVLPIEKFQSILLPRNAILLQQLLFKFCSIICQVVIYGRLKTKENFKLLARKVLVVAYERWWLNSSASNTFKIQGGLLQNDNWIILKMSENTAAIEEAKSKCTSAKGRFTRKRNFLIKSIESDQGIEVVETNYAKLADVYDELEDKHETCVELLPDEQSEEAEAWMTGVQEKFNDATDRKIKYVEKITLRERRTR